MDSEIVILGLTSLTDFYKNDMCQIVKKNLFCSNNAPEIHIFNSLRHQKLLLVANQLQDFFIFDVNSEDTAISKLAS